MTLFDHCLDDQMQDEMSGAAAVCVLIKNKKIYCVSILHMYIPL